jgi:hypothetical protein
MNERIQKLMIRAIGGVPCYDASVGLSLNQEEAEKFAELIVRECMWQVVKDDQVPHDTQVLIGGRFKEHFGVEE